MPKTPIKIIHIGSPTLEHLSDKDKDAFYKYMLQLIFEEKRLQEEYKRMRKGGDKNDHKTTKQ